MFLFVHDYFLSAERWLINKQWMWRWIARCAEIKAMINDFVFYSLQKYALTPADDWWPASLSDFSVLSFHLHPVFVFFPSGAPSETHISITGRGPIKY